VQDRNRMHGYALASESRKRTSGQLTWLRELEKRVRGSIPESNPLIST